MSHGDTDAERGSADASIREPLLEQSSVDARKRDQTLNNLGIPGAGGFDHDEDPDLQPRCSFWYPGRDRARQGTRNQGVSHGESSSEGEKDVPLGENEGTLNILTSSTNLAKLIVGAGATALPFAFARLGMICSIGFLLLIAFMTHFSIQALTLGALSAGVSTYSGSLKGLVGRWASVTLELSLVLRCAGLMVVYIVIGTDILAGRTSLPGVVCEVVEVLGLDVSQNLWCCNRKIMALLICLFFVAPLIASDHLAGSTSKAAFVGLMGVCLWAGSTVLVAIVANLKGGAATIPWMPPHGLASFAVDITELLSTLPVIATAYTCQMSVHYSMRELQNFSQSRVSTVSAFAVTFCTIIFLSVGLGSVAAFADKKGNVPADILEAFTYENLIDWIPGILARVLGLIVRLAFLMSILANFPMQTLPYRDSFSRLILFRQNRLSPHGAMYWVVTYGSLIAFYFIAISAKSIWTPLQLVGATAGAYIAFFAPAMVALMSLKRRGLLATSPAAASAQEKPHYWKMNAWSLIVAGCIQAITGVAAVFMAPS